MIEKKYPIHSCIPKSNPVDNKLKYLIDSNIVPNTSAYMFNEDFGVSTRTIVCKAYWEKVASFFGEEELTFILEYEQKGNWNGYLYRACQARLSEIAIDAAEKELDI